MPGYQGIYSEQQSTTRMTEDAFDKLVSGLGFSDSTKAVMRKSVGLDYDANLIPSPAVYEKRALMLGWSKIPKDRRPL